MRESLAIVADRHMGIEYATNIMYPNVAFGICVQHLVANLKTIRNPDMHRYLVSADLTKWSRAYFNGRRYAIMTTNIVESLNSVDQKARLMAVGFLVEWLRELIQRWFVERREEALKITSKLAPKAEKLIRTNFSLGLTVMVCDNDHIMTPGQLTSLSTPSPTMLPKPGLSICAKGPVPADDFRSIKFLALMQWPSSIRLAAQRARMLLKKSDRKLSILPIQSVIPEGHGFVGFCSKVKNMRLFGVVDVMVMDTNDKLVLTQYCYAYVQQQEVLKTGSLETKPENSFMQYPITRLPDLYVSMETCGVRSFLDDHEEEEYYDGTLLHYICGHGVDGPPVTMETYYVGSFLDDHKEEGVFKNNFTPHDGIHYYDVCFVATRSDGQGEGTSQH
ncbi:hypothetical protein TIFTF001_017803 [Ficus carica]|uniref:Uncharacterized protein n=1 Tax=Ficus carica TaxID=3494 RepID=A0AA88A9Y8_FICCA|nr:hypothetical protein TIFTF001_017803 [Ficus carica]